MDRQVFGGSGSGGVAYAPPWTYSAKPATTRPTGSASPNQTFFQQRATGQAKPAAGQAEVGSLFRELRRVLGFTPAEAAQRLNTHLDVISALEAGDVNALPAWSETVRVVTAYTGLARIDAVPVLSLIQMGVAEREASAAALGTDTRGEEKKPAPRRDPSERWPAFKLAVVQPIVDAVSAARTVLSTVRVGHLVGVADRAADAALTAMRRNARRTATLVAALFVIVAYFGQGSSLQASLATLHSPIAKLMRSAQDYLLERAAPMRDGLRWIEVDDPRSRRTDKLVAKQQ